MHQITGKTRLLGVIGDPVEHSRSPAMHNAAIATLGLDYLYLPFPVKADQLAEAVAGFEAIDLVGFNVTIPHKQAIMSFLAEISPLARTIGAVNTVWRTADKNWQGTNTDVVGFISPLQSLQRDWQQVRPTILGYGGAARAVAVGCAQLGCPEIAVIGRNEEKLTRFVASWQQSDLAGRVKAYSWDKLAELVSQSDLLVNTTPIGMWPHIDASPIEKTMQLKPTAIAYDLIYTPSPTRFLQQAQNQGAIALDGAEMLVQQGAAALQIWLDREVPVDVMRQAMLPG